MFYFQAAKKKEKPKKNFELKSLKKKNGNRASLPRKKSPTSILNNKLQTQSKEKNKVKQTQHCSKPTDSQKNKKPKPNIRN